MTRDRAGLMLLVALAACGGEGKARPPVDDRPPPIVPPPAAAAGPQLAFRRGMLRMVPTLTFRSCDGATLSTVHDSTRNHLVPAYRVLQPNEAEGMYVEVMAAELPSGGLVLRSLEYAGSPAPGQGCDQRRTGHLLRAFGVRPEWRVLVSSSGIDFTQTAEPGAMSFPAALPDDSAGVLRYRAPGGFHMLLIQSPCTVDSTRTFGSMQAIVEVAGKTLRGCASHGVVR